MNTKATYIDLLTVKVGKRAGVYLEGQIRGDKVYMPLTPDGARQIATDLERAAQALDAEKKATHMRSRAENKARSSSGIFVCSERGSLGFAAKRYAQAECSVAPQPAARHSDSPRVPENSVFVPRYAVSRRDAGTGQESLTRRLPFRTNPKPRANASDAQAFVEHTRSSPFTPSGVHRSCIKGVAKLSPAHDGLTSLCPQKY